MPGRLPRRAPFEALESRVLLATHYLSPTGSDGAPGTAEAPWATLAHAAGAVAAGDELVLSGGTYAGGVTFDVPGLLIRSADGERAIISSPSDNSSIQQTLRFNINANGATLRGVELVGGYYYALKLESHWGYGPAVQDVTIEDCWLHDSGRDCIKITPGCDNVTIRRCEIYNSGRRDASNAEGIDNVNADNMVVQDCYIHDIATNGLYSKGGALASVIERNRVENCGNLGIVLGYYTDAEFFDPEQNPESYESIDSVIRNNIIIHTAYAGVGLYSALRPHVYNNTMIDVAREGQGGIIFTPGWEFTPANRLIPTKDPEVINNVVIVGGAHQFVMIREVGLDPAGTLVMANNWYGRTVATATGDFRDDRGGTRWTGSLAEWQARMGVDLTSAQGDPVVDDITGRPMAGSPLIDAGADLSSTGFSDDIDAEQRPTGSAWDIGGDEVGGTPLPDTRPPSVLARSPVPNAVRVAVASNVTATFTEPVVADSVSFALADAAGAPVDAAVTYQPGLRAVTLDPAADLAPSSVYTVTLGGARDAAGNVMLPVTWSFTTVSAPTPIFSAVPYYGDLRNYTPVTPARWEVTQDPSTGDERLLLNSSDFEGPGEDLVGEFALVNARTFGDFDLSLRARTNESLSENPSADYVVVFGHVDASNYSYLMINGRPENTRLFHVADGVATGFAPATVAGLPDANWHETRVSRTGSTVTVRLDGQTILTVTDPSLAAAGGVGPGSYNDSAYFDDINVVPGGDAPRVTDVFVSGSTWAAPFKDGLRAVGAGDPAFGFRVGAGGEVPWNNIDTLALRFDRAVTVAADDVTVRSRSGATTYALAATDPLSFDAATNTLTVRLAARVGNDRVEVVLDGAAGGVATGDVLLDGDFSGTLPSGDGQPGGNFAFPFDVLAGDVVRDGGVNALDMADVKRRLGTSTATPGTGTGAYNLFADVNGDGRINALDLAGARQRLGSRLPAVTAVAGLFGRRQIIA